MPTAADTVEALIHLGELISTATSGKSVDWETFLKGADYQTISGAVEKQCASLGQDSLSAAIAAATQKQQTILNGRKLQALNQDEMDQYFDLAKLKLVLSAREANASNVAVFGSWLIEKGLPTLIEVAPVVLPLLLA